MILVHQITCHVHNKKEGHRVFRQKTDDRGMKEECKSVP